MENPIVSIIIPIYNVGSKIRDCIQSILNQTYNNLEIVMVDDGSSDESFNECMSLQNDYPFIKLIHQENAGSGPARNMGIINSTGEYLYFPDADDVLESNAIERLVYATENGKNDLVVFGFRSISPKGVIKIEKKYPEVLMLGEDIRKNYSPHIVATGELGIQGAPWNKFFKSEIIRNYNVRFPALRRHQDEAFIASYVSHVKNVKFISDVLYNYYTNDLNREWSKYPKDYIDAVIGLNESRKSTILSWCPSDDKTRQMIQREYICNVIKSLELTFSPKFGLSYNKRRQFIAKLVEKSKIKETSAPKILHLYQKIILSTIKLNLNTLTYVGMYLKIQLQKHL